MNAEAFINSIVEEVLKKLDSKMKKATVIFTGGACGFTNALEQVRLLKEDGWDLKILLSNSAEYVLTPQYIKNKLGISELYLEKDVKGLRQFYEGISACIIPTLTLNTAVKISLGIADNMTTNIASHIIMSGVPFIAARDACDLHNPVRKKLGLDKTPKAYLAKMDDHLNNLESYGIKLVNANALFQTVQENVFTFSNKAKVKSAEVEPKDVRVFRKKVLTRMDIIEAKQNKTDLKVPYTTILSPLALETAKEFGVKIIQE